MNSVIRALARDSLRRIPLARKLWNKLKVLRSALTSGPHARMPDGRHLKMLAGTEHARFALPIDYTPSRDFQPRYGYTHPPIRALETWFERHSSGYAEFVAYLRSLDISHIAMAPETRSSSKPSWTGGPICAFDSLALYGMIRKLAPRCYLEIGSGMTTCFARQAVVDGGMTTRIVSVDPEPRSEIDSICDEVIRDGLETCDLGIFEKLEANDIVFFDGSHRSFMNSDVTVFFIDVLPRLKPGVIVHIHDIHLPWDYPEWAKNWYWNEQYLLAVYLIGHMNSISVLLPTAFVCRSHVLEQCMRSPFADLGSANDSWRGGGSMWFTHGGRPREMNGARG